MTSLVEQSFKAAEDTRRMFDMSAEKSVNIALEAATSGSFGDSAFQTMNARQQHQYKAFKGVPYLSIKAIGQRIAGQEIKVARVVGTNPNPNRRRIEPWQVKNAPGFIQKTVAHGQLEMLPTHPLLDALEMPNDLMPCWSLVWSVVASMLLTGTGYWHMHMADDKIQIWPLPSHWVTPIDDKEKGFRARYDVTPPGQATKFEVESRDMAPFVLPNPENPRQGLAPVSTHVDMLITDQQIHRAQRETFTLGIIPKTLITTGKVVGPDGKPGARPWLSGTQRKQLVHVVRQLAQSSGRWDPFVVDGLIESITKFSMNPEEMDYQNSGKMVEARLRKIWGVSDIVLGEVGSANKASAAAADKIFTDNTVNPLITLMSQIMTIWVAPRFEQDDRLRVWIEKAEPRDPDLESKQNESAWKSGAITKNEYREFLGKPPDKNGDVYKVEQFLNVDFVPAQITNNRTREMNSFAIKSTTKITRKAIEMIHVKQVSKFSRIFTVDMTRFFLVQIKSVTNDLNKIETRNALMNKKTVADDLVNVIFNPRDWDEQLENNARPSMTAAMAEAAFAELQLFELSKHAKWSKAEQERLAERNEMLKKNKRTDLVRQLEPEDVIVPLPPELLQVIDATITETFKQDYWLAVNDNTGDQIALWLNRGFEEGLSIREISALIERELAGPNASMRAIRMARTEMTGAANGGHQATMDSLAADGLIDVKEWLSVLANTTRPDHSAAHQQRVPVNGNFIVGGESAPYPGHFGFSAKERINCLCSHLSGTILDNIE